MNSTIRTLILVTLVGVGAFAGSTVATSHASITASPATPDETATHTAMVTVENESITSLDGFALDYRDAAVDVSEVTAENIVVGIDRGGDNEGAEVDENVTVGSVEASNDGTMLNLTFNGSTSLSQGDEIVVQIQDVQNPEAGEYTVPLVVNPQSSGGEAEAMLTISESANGTETANETETEVGDETETETETGDETETETEVGDETETETEADAVGDTETEAGGGVDETETIGENETITEGPGFGVVVAVLAMLGAALVVARRQQ